MTAQEFYFSKTAITSRLRDCGLTITTENLRSLSEILVNIREPLLISRLLDYACEEHQLLVEKKTMFEFIDRLPQTKDLSSAERFKEIQLQLPPAIVIGLACLEPGKEVLAFQFLAGMSRLAHQESDLVQEMVTADKELVNRLDILRVNVREVLNWAQLLEGVISIADLTLEEDEKTWVSAQQYISCILPILSRVKTATMALLDLEINSEVKYEMDHVSSSINRPVRAHRPLRKSTKNRHPDRQTELLFHDYHRWRVTHPEGAEILAEYHQFNRDYIHDYIKTELTNTLMYGDLIQRYLEKRKVVPAEQSLQVKEKIFSLSQKLRVNCEKILVNICNREGLTFSDKTVFTSETSDLTSSIQNWLVKNVHNFSLKEGVRINLNTDLRQKMNVQIPEDDLHRILINLVGNAAIHTSEGSITISTRQEGKWGVFTVEDTGEGILPEYLPDEIFKENFTTRRNSSNIPGTGLGLSIVKRLVDQAYGLIEVGSEVGKGTVFTVRLPLSTVEK